MTAREKARELLKASYEVDKISDKQFMDLIERALLDTIEECAKVAERIGDVREFQKTWDNTVKNTRDVIAAEIRKMGAGKCNQNKERKET